MFSLTAFISKMNAHEIASAIQAFYDNKLGGKFFRLAYTTTGGTDEGEIWVRPQLTESPVTLVNGDQIVRCESENNELVDVIIPGSHREYMPAAIIVAHHDTQ